MMKQWTPPPLGRRVRLVDPGTGQTVLVVWAHRYDRRTTIQAEEDIVGVYVLVTEWTIRKPKDPDFELPVGVEVHEVRGNPDDPDVSASQRYFSLGVQERTVKGTRGQWLLITTQKRQ